MTPQEAFITAEQMPGTVGAYLATPAGMNPLKVVAWTAALIAVLLAAAGVLVWMNGGVLSVSVGAITLLTTPDLMPYVVPIMIAAGMCLMVYVALVLGSAILGANDEIDLVSEAKHGMLRMMIDRPRFGVERQTPLPSVGLRSKTLSGTLGGAVEVYSQKYRFTDSDFVGAKPSDFGGYDIVVQNGRLYVFANQRSKERWLLSRD